ncbi:MAG: hypothetical protein QNJ45_03500 [Ardenticatenaceae bacterium]|nr:hypothetical protein [Ardenticatenaceae bacterium]
MMNKTQRNQLISGIGLVLLGILFLGNQIIEFGDFGVLVLPAMALIFTVWAILTRASGLFIPAGVFVGVSAGVGLMSLPLAGRVADEGGLFMLGFAGGWVFITVMTAIFSDHTFWWALIPAAIMAVIGIGVLTEGILLQILGYANVIWPLVLIGIGLYLVFRRKEDEPEEKEPEPASYKF